MTDQPTKFTQEQVDILRGSLSSSVVKSRKQGQTSLSYIEGWWAISEANRIFGFESWDQELLETKCVTEKPRKIGSDRRDGWGVTYIAKVRIRVGSIIREGVGAGHGIDVDLGLAHESAIKEAATDAMKRAFITFGNLFGLALYDKKKENVDDTPHDGITPEELRLQKEEDDRQKKRQQQVADRDFLVKLHQRFEEVGLEQSGIYTLAVIGQVLTTDGSGNQVMAFERLTEKQREKVFEVLDASYAKNLNEGKNARGAVVVSVAADGSQPKSNVDALRAAANGV